MRESSYYPSPYQPQVGCILMLVILAFMCLMPLFLIETAQIALQKLHVPPGAAMVVLFGILIGGLVNIPIHVIEKEEPQVMPGGVIHTMMGWVPVIQRRQTRTIVAVNLGGCLIPVALAVFELVLILNSDTQVKFALMIAVAVNITVCYFVAKPIQGVGIAMPAFTSPAVAVGVVWLLLMPAEYQMVRAPVAFIAGILGPLVGADLLHLRDITTISARVVSIGGAGTFDGIVLSGLLAALIA